MNILTVVWKDEYSTCSLKRWIFYLLFEKDYKAPKDLSLGHKAGEGLGAGQLEFLYFEYRQLAPQPYKIINETKQSIYQEKDLKAPKDGKPRLPSDIYINQSKT